MKSGALYILLKSADVASTMQKLDGLKSKPLIVSSSKISFSGTMIGSPVACLCIETFSWPANNMCPKLDGNLVTSAQIKALVC